MVEHVEDGVNGFVVPPNDPGALAEALRRLIANPELRRTMGSCNAKKIRQSYTCEAVADAYLSIYHQIIADRRADGACHARS